MSVKVEQFIENYITEIDRDLTEIYRVGFDELTYDEFQELNGLFTEAGIEYEREQYNVLDFIITMAIEEWCNGESGVSQMPLKMFIEAFLSNCLGLPLDVVKTHMYNNRSEWEDQVEIKIQDGIAIMARKF